MTQIQILLSNLEMVDRLLNNLSPEDVSTPYGRLVFRHLHRKYFKLRKAVKSYPFEREEKC